MKFIPTTRKNGECNVCGDTSGKCRRLESEDISLCMSFADARKGEIQNGYKCLKPDTGKGWATFKFDNSQAWSEEQRREWKEKATLRKQAAVLEAQAREKRSIAAVERDRLYRQLLDELELHPDDRADLRRRGFSDLEIDLVGYKSISHYQALRNRYPDLLPGIAPGGKQTISLGVGYLCPVRNRDGLIVACQIRLRVLSDGSKNRYRWFSGGEGQVLHFFLVGGNPEGELPLAICRPIDRPLFPAICEGTGAKPNLVALHQNAYVIGAAGGQWASSPATLRSAIEDAIAATGDQKLRLFPDAGDVQNRPVAMRWKALIELLQSWGYSLVVGWWNQRAKGDPDVDELTPEQFAQIRYLEPKDFLVLIAEEFPSEPKGFGSDSTAKNTSTRDDRAWELWRLARKFTPTHTIDQRYFDFPVPEPGTLTAAKSGLGSGKTEWMKRIVQQLNDEGWIALGYRNSLLIQSATRWGFYHLHNDEAQNLLADPQLKVALCVDSITHFELHYFDGKNIILDELCSVIRHLLFAKTAVGKQRRECKAKFVEALKRAKRIFVLDGLLSDKDVAYLQKLIGEPRKIIKVKNDYRGNGKNISILRGAIDEEKIKLNDRSPIIQMIRSSPCCSIATDSQIEAEALDKLLTNQGKRVVRLDSKNSSEPWVTALLNDTANWFLATKPDVFIFTPTAESGVDVPIVDYFQHFFCLFFGAVLTDAQQQMIGRIRDEKCPVFIYCRTNGIPSDKISRAVLPENLMTAVINFVIEDGWATLSNIPQEQAIKELFKQVTKLSQNEHFHHECQLLALQNHEERNLRECLIEALTEAGHNLQEVVLSKSDIQDLKDQKEEVKDLNAEDIFESEDITMEEVNQIDAKTGLDWKTRCKIQKAKLIDRLPGINFSDQWSVDFVRKVLYSDQSFISRCELFWLFHHPEIAQRLQQVRWFNLLKVGHVDITHHRSRYLKIKEMREIRLDAFFEPGFMWHQDSSEVQQLYNSCKDSEQRQSNLGQAVGKLTPVDFVGRLLKQLGLSTTEAWITTENGRIRGYQINPESFSADLDKVAILEALNIRYIDLLDGTAEAINWALLLGVQEVGESTASEKIEADHLAKDFYKNQGSGDQNFASQTSNFAPSSPANEPEHPSVPEAPEPLRGIVREIEQCQSLKEFIAVCRGAFKGKTEGFIKPLFQFLSPQSRDRVLDWTEQPSALRASG